jgi:hypothetical protein
MYVLYETLIFFFLSLFQMFCSNLSNAMYAATSSSGYVSIFEGINVKAKSFI